MQPKLLLVKAITLLYRESQLPPTTDKSYGLVRNILSIVKSPDNMAITLSPEWETINGLKNTALTMCENPPDHEYVPIEILQRVKMNCGEDLELYESFELGIQTELEEKDLKRIVLNIKRELQNHFREEKIGEVVHKASATLKFHRDQITDMKKFVAEVCSELEPYQQDSITKDPAIVSHVSFGDISTMTEVFKSIQQEANGNAILKTGWQGLNRMLQGGFRRGEEVVIGALQHKYKTGYTLSLFTHFAMFNVPQMLDPTKKPLLLRISFEDDINTNMQFLYSYIKGNETGKAVTKEELSSLTPEEISQYVQTKMGVNGYHIEMMRVDPTQWTYIDIINKALEFEAEGYEIHAVILDYLNLIPKTGCIQTGATGQDVRDLYRRIRAFFNKRRILLITPHQMSTEAKQMIRDGKDNFVKELVGKGYYEGSKQIDQEVDVELYIHIEIVNGKSFITVQRGKHRGLLVQTPLLDQYYAQAFTDYGLPWDIYTQDLSLRRPGAGLKGTADENPFWSQDASFHDPLALAA